MKGRIITVHITLHTINRHWIISSSATCVAKSVNDRKTANSDSKVSMSMQLGNHCTLRKVSLRKITWTTTWIRLHCYRCTYASLFVNFFGCFESLMNVCNQMWRMYAPGALLLTKTWRFAEIKNSLGAVTKHHRYARMSVRINGLLLWLQQAHGLTLEFVNVNVIGMSLFRRMHSCALIMRPYLTRLLHC